uniref:SAM-dependent MTase TRM10-type domain-containing protein n=2 Tax=Parascaris univalens TaxID=6257 RepID=A0A915CFB8_PARUN
TMQWKVFRRCFLASSGGDLFMSLFSFHKLSISKCLRLRFSSAPHASKENINLNLPVDVLPSREFVASLKRNYERDKLARLLSEMEVIFEISAEVPRTLSDNDWQLYFNLQDVSERERFLARLYAEQLNAIRIAQQRAESAVARQKILEEQQIRHDRGEMVYAPRFHTYFDIRGSFFRRLIDCMYGCRLLAAERCDELPPRLIIDCRFLHQFSDNYQSRFIRQIQKLHDANWFSRNPFHISVANLLADDQLAHYIKRYWLFLCGPTRLRTDEENDFTQIYEELDADLHDSSNSISSEVGFTPHPFIPTISSRSIRDNLPDDVRDDEIAYISWTAPRLLDGPLTNYKAIVICSSYDLQPWSSSLSAARADRLTPYRIPFDRYVKWERGRKIMPIDITANIIRSVYVNDGDWKSAILENVPEYHFNKDHPIAKHNERNALDIEKKNRLKALQQAIMEMDRRRIDALGSHQARKGAKEQTEPRRRVHHHRYSREERRAGINSQNAS